MWSTATLSQARSSAAAAYAGGDVFFAGGCIGANQFTDVVDIYNVAAGTWSTAHLSQARGGISVAVAGSKVYFAGGALGNCYTSNVVDIYDTSTGIWTTANLSQARSGLAATSINGKVIFAGGLTNSGGLSGAVDILDTTTAIWSTATLSEAQCNLGAASCGTQAFFGGGDYASFSNTVDVYDTGTGNWSQMHLSQSRGAVGCASVGTQVLFAGGQYQFQTPTCSSVVDIYDTSTSAWSTASLSQARGGVGAASGGTKAYFAGGFGASSRVDIYDSASGTWSAGSLSQGRSGVAAAATGDTAFFGGGDTGSGYSNVVDIRKSIPQNYSTISSHTAFTLGDTTTVSGLMLLNAGASLNLDIQPLTVGSMSGSAPISLGTGQLIVGGDGTSTTYSGVISGSGTLTKVGSGALTLSGNNSYTGETRITSGKLILGQPNALSGVLNLDPSDSGTLDLGNYTSVTIGGLKGSRDFLLENDSGAPIALSVGGSTFTTYSGVLGGKGSLSVTGFLTLTGNNTFSGGVSISGGAGDLCVNTLNPAGTPGPLGTGTGPITMGTSWGGGMLSYGGDTATSDRAFTIAQVCEIGVTSSTTTLTLTGPISGSGSLWTLGLGVLAINGPCTYGGTLTVRSGTLQIPSVNDNNTYGPLGSSSSPVQIGWYGNATLEYTGPSASTNKAFTIAPTYVGCIQVDNPSTTLLASGVVSGGNLVKAGAGTLSLTGTNTFQGTVTIAGGTLSIPLLNLPGTAGPLGTNSNSITLGSSGWTGTLEYSGASVSTSRQFVMATGGLGGFQIDNAATTFTITTYITGAGGLIKSGAGTLVLAAAYGNTFSGDTRIAQGTLALANNMELEGNTLDMNGADSGSLDLGTFTSLYLGGIKGSRNLLLQNDSGGAVSLILGSTTSPYSGCLSGSGSLLISGGSVTFAGTNTFTGDTMPEDGTLTLANTNALENSTLDMVNPIGTNVVQFSGISSVQIGGIKGGSGLSLGTVNLTVGGNNQNNSFNGGLYGTGTLTKIGSGTAYLGLAMYFGPVTVQSGTLSVGTVNNVNSMGDLGDSAYPVTLGGSGSTGTIECTWSSGNSSNKPFTLATGGSGAFQIDSASTGVTLYGVIGGSGGFIKSGPGTLYLQANNTYTGTTTVLGGTLCVTGALAKNDSQNVLVRCDPNFANIIRRPTPLAAIYTGLGSSSVNGLGSAADLLAGTNATGTDSTLDMAWRQATTGENALVSDVLSLSGMVNSKSSSQTDPFVLRMSYNPSNLVLRSGLSEADAAASGDIFLAWLNPSDNRWENAVSGNFGGAGSFAEVGPWTDYGSSGLSDDLGRWGIDPITHTVWAVLNHNCSLAVTTYLPVDTNHDGTDNAADIDAICQHFTVAPSGYMGTWPRALVAYQAQYDVNGDGVVSQDDVTYELSHYFLTSYGDADLSKATDFMDFQTLLNHWQSSGAGIGWAQADFNGDGVVDFLDFQILLNYWQPGGWNFSPSQTPEPASLSLILLGGLAILRRKKN